MSVFLDKIVELGRADAVERNNAPVNEAAFGVHQFVAECGPDHMDLASMLLDNVDPHLFMRGLVGAIKAREQHPCEPRDPEFCSAAQLLVDQMIDSVEQYMRDVEGNR